MEQMNNSGIVCVGIDPGKSGAMAVIFPDGKVTLTEYTGPFCYRYALPEFCGMGSEYRIVVERLFARPGKMSSAKSNFELGRCVGELETMLHMLGLGFQAVTPQAWQKEFGVSGDKAAHIQIARQLFPTVSLKRTEKCKTDFDGYADALLMAEYARRRLHV